MSKLLRIASTTALAALAIALPPKQAEACGGNFCDSGPTAMPVDQTGENILFKIGADYVEAHIQIQIDPNTEAEQFAWVIPVQALPTFSVGSQILFDNMLQASVPRYGTQLNQDFCGGNGDFGDDGGESGSLSTGDPGGDGDGDPGNGGPDVVFQGSVGAFEVAVLDGGTVESVMQWLGDNGYQQDPNAEPILAEYLEEGFLFVALKLGVESGVDDVHPIVLRMATDEPCVPIRLTRIAASENMDIRTFFLGEKRVVPLNYRHVLVNPLKIDWFNNANNYKEVITLAVDAENADGNAFVTEYAGASDIISLAGVWSGSWDPVPYSQLLGSPVGVIEELEAQGLIDCDPNWDSSCTTFHPLLQGLLDQYVPVPANVTPVEYYDCMTCYMDLIDLDAWNAAEFAAALDDRIFRPGLKARDLILDNPYLTRMYTTISPNEMLVDPIFEANDSLGDVGFQRIAQQTLHCDGSTSVELPDGRVVFFGPGEPLVWPEFQEQMPIEEDVDESAMATNAPLISLTDNTELIDSLLAEYNTEHSMDPDGPGANDDGLGGAGCACSVDGGDAPIGGALLGFMTLGVMGLVRRRK